MKKFTVTINIARKKYPTHITKKYQSSNPDIDFHIAAWKRYIKRPGDTLEVTLHKNTPEDLKNG